MESTLQQRHAAADEAVAHAVRALPGWKDKALAWVDEYAQRTDYFLMEECRLYAEERGLPRAPDGRAWGAVAIDARQRKIIAPAGYAPAHDGSPKTLWRKFRT